MPTVDAVVFTTWKHDANDNDVPNAIDDIFAWAVANNESLPLEPTVCGRYEDVTAILAPDIAIGKVFACKLEITMATGAQFAADPRIFTLGRRIFDDDGNVTNSNWNTTLSGGERKQVLDWLENHGISRAQVSARFGGNDTRLEIAQKLKAYFKE